MAIRDWGIQVLQKFSEDDSGEINGAKGEASGDADSDALCQTLKRIFAAKPGKAYGNLNMLNEHTVCGPWIKQWYEQKIPFQRLINEAITAIKERVDAMAVITHSYCLWAHEQQGEQRYLYFFMVESSVTQVINASFTIEPIEHLDPQALSFAIKIDVQALFSADSTRQQQDIVAVYLQRQQRKLAEAACLAFGFVSCINRQQETEMVFTGIERYTSAMDEPEAMVFRNKAIAYCKEQEDRGEGVAINELSLTANEDKPEGFAEFFSQAQPDAPATLYPESRKLKQLVRFTGRGQGISLSFSSEAINQSVVYNHEQDTLVITDIPKSLKAQLKRFLNKSSEAETKESEDAD